MLNFKFTTIIFFSTTIICWLLHYYLHISTLWIILPLSLYLTAIIYGSANIQSGFFVQAFCNSETTEKIIALTFDDGPNKKFTTPILKILSEYNAPATFFVIGKNILGNEAILKQIHELGHIIGNHTFSHSFFIDFKSKLGFMYELDQTSDLIFEATGKRPKFFRPPYGVTTPNLVRASNTLEYKIIGWNARSLDTTNDSVETISKRVIDQIKPGAIILFHDTSSKTLDVLKQTLNFAKDNGFKVVSVEGLVKIKAYS